MQRDEVKIIVGFKPSPYFREEWEKKLEEKGRAMDKRDRELMKEDEEEEKRLKERMEEILRMRPTPLPKPPQ